MKKINYKTAYDENDTICGYVMAEEYKDGYIISNRQLDRAFKKRTIGGIANVIFLTDSPVYVDKNDRGIELFQ